VRSGRPAVAREAGGLPGLFLLKSVLVVFCVSLLAQGASLALRSLLVLLGHPEFLPEEPLPKESFP